MVKYRRRIGVAMLLLFAVAFFLLVIVNTIMGKKGFYYDPAVPASDFIFFDRNACYVNLIGGKNSEIVSGRGMVDIPQTMEDRDYCKDFYFTFANTIIVIDEGRWLGIRFGKRIYMLQWNNSEVSDPYDCYKYILGHPYFVLDYAGKERDYSDEALENWKKLYWSKRLPRFE